MGDDWCDAGRDYDGISYEPADNIGPSLAEQRRQQQAQQAQKAARDSYEAQKQKQKADPIKPVPPKGR